MSQDIWRTFARRQQKIEKAFVPKMAKAVKGEIKKVTDWIKSNEGTNGIHSQLHILFNHNSIKSIITELWNTSALSEANVTYRQLKKTHLKSRGMGFNPAWQKIIDTYLTDIEKFKTVEQINDTTKKRLLEIISKGIQNGDSYEEIVNAIEEDDIPLKRAMLIVRTESVGAMNMGAMMGAISTGIMYDKEWITSGDERVRGRKITDKFSHLYLEGQTVHMDQPYNNGEEIKYPGDKSSSAGNFCNCRCCQRFIARRDSDGRIMMYGATQ